MYNRYKIYKNKETKKFDIYEVTGKFIVSATLKNVAEYIVEKLNKDDNLNIVNINNQKERN